jgi:hypothetical protein
MKKKWYRSKWIYFVLTLLLGVLIGIDFRFLFYAINSVRGWDVFLYYLGWTLFCSMNYILVWTKIELVEKEEK